MADIAVEYSLADSTTFDIIHPVENALLVGMRKRKWSKRELIDAVFYLTDLGGKYGGGCPVFSAHFYRKAAKSPLL